MTSLEEARKRWMVQQPLFRQFGFEICRILETDIRADGILARVESRAKEIDSLVRKLILKRENTYETIGDKLGVRVIVRYKSEITRVLTIAGQIFEISGVENTADRLQPNSTGYLSIHAVLKLRAADRMAEQYPPETFHAELQVRTLAQHLWAEMAHDTVYKNDELLNPLPNPLKRRIFVLAGVVELADEEFNRIEQELPVTPELIILQALNRYHFTLTSRPGDPLTSLSVMRVLIPLYKQEAARIVTRLGEFYSTHLETLRHVYSRAEQAPERSAFLFQPEALMIYDLLESDQLATRTAWNRYFPEKELERFANDFGMSFD